MNKTMTSLLTLGAGALMYRMASQYDMPNKKTMKRMKKRMNKMF
ncbi:YrzQ family protein [Bacillus atrophaeus]|nr:YrzQ family protein [Bacillus atrophaeus]MCY8912596.1 YrzQ family protein [Bacillus atrophaeus]MCY9113906.1 YrzQ family protein [Bacillus atrophaeus]MEC0927150.1 YrzQ family protein [Bacillus atrophaeus]MEC0932009.1 YrzQ family protein [Bacillus atrophaeus]